MLARLRLSRKRCSRQLSYNGDCSAWLRRLARVLYMRTNGPARNDSFVCPPNRRAGAVDVRFVTLLLHGAKDREDVYAANRRLLPALQTDSGIPFGSRVAPSNEA